MCAVEMPMLLLYIQQASPTLNYLGNIHNDYYFGQIKSGVQTLLFLQHGLGRIVSPAPQSGHTNLIFCLGQIKAGNRPGWST